MKLQSLCVLALTCPAVAQAPRAALDEAVIAKAIEAVLERDRIPGTVVGITLGEDTVFRRAFGIADAKSERKLTADALFQVGSVTKPMTATLLAQLEEADALDLDDTLGEHLPESLELPASVAALTLRQIATHTAGLPRNPANRRASADGSGYASQSDHLFVAGCCQVSSRGACRAGDAGGRR